VEQKLNPRIDEAEAGSRKLFFVDASHFVHGAFLCSVWCFVRLFLRTPSGRKRFNVLGALDYATKDLITITNLTYITAETVCELLTTLAARYPGIPITLVLDNARYQRCRLVQDLAASLGIELLFLPSYSPNLNLIERLWKFVKGECLNGKYYETFPAFQAGIEDCLQKIPTQHQDAVASLITRNFQLYDEETFLQV
jgi:transposase